MEKLLRVTYVSKGDAQTLEGALVVRFFDFAIHAERTEFIKLVSWAMRNERILTVSGVEITQQ